MSAVLMEGNLPQLGNGISRQSFRFSAIAISTALVIITVVAGIAGNGPGREIRAFLPICATLWATAELLTAFLLFSQFYVAGKLSYALIASGYAITGLLTVPYLFTFPGIFFEAPFTSGDLQVSVWIWIIWHTTFPVLIAITHIIDPTLEHRIVPRRDIVRVLVLIIGATALFAVVAAGIVYSARDHLVTIVLPGGKFSQAYSAYVAPGIVVANLFACAVVSRNLRRARALQLWVAVALLTSALDGALNATSPGRYTPSWYVGKLESLTTASVVLVMLLFEISTLYRRLFDVASIDPLTGLHNRRSLEVDIREVVATLPTMQDGAAVLMLDLDKFKSLNDTYGHALGDDVLRVVARVLRATASRPSDMIARYGGEEFVVLLPETTLLGAQRVAERIRLAIASTPIVLPDGTSKTITTSVGVAHAKPHDPTSADIFFAGADRALYIAKTNGRNCIATAEAVARPALNLSAVV